MKGRSVEVERSTLVGIATGTPDGGVSVVRISGPRSFAVAEQLCGAAGPPRRLIRRKVTLGSGAFDDALVVWMPGPRSFTGEDVVELHVHAGARNVGAVVQACLAAGAEAAGPGDFSRRAFELGRLTLDQAEGVAALIGAQTEAALDQARRLIAGELGREVDRLREGLADLRAEVEANLDFPEDVDEGDTRRWIHEIDACIHDVRRWLGGFEAGRRAREKARVVLAGPPNGGKSSLFNALLGEARAIVADMPGTTRDYVEADLELGPYVAVLVDTAGLRETREQVESEGVARSRGQLDRADVVLWIESADAADAEESPASGAERLYVETKRDLGTRRPEWLGVSMPRHGVDAIKLRLREWFEAGGSQAWIGLARHRERAAEAIEQLQAAASILREDGPLEAAAFELAAAELRLGEITGRSALGPIGEDVLDRIFSRFCIGK